MVVGVGEWAFGFPILFRFLSLEFTTGLQYSWGRGASDLFAGFSFDEEGNIVDRLKGRQLDYSRIKILLGFNLPFAAPGGKG